MKKPLTETKLSVIILNHNTCKLLQDCLLSLPSKQEYQVLVVDNASSDGSVKMVKENFPNVDVIARRVNDGYARGNNAARKVAKGKFVLFLNSDTVIFPNTLETMVNFMEMNNDVGIATCYVELPNGNFYYAAHRGFPTLWNSLCYFLGLAKLFPKLRLFSGYTLSYLPLDTIHEIDACSGTFLMIRRDLLEKINWFDEDYFAYGEDIEMCYQVKRLGYKVMFVPTVKIMHYWGASSGLKSTSKDVTVADIQNSQRWNRARYEAMKIFYDKHYYQKYPKIVRKIVILALKVISFLRKNCD